MKILLMLLLPLATISIHANEVSYYTSEKTMANDYPFSDAVTIGDIVYLSGIIGEKNGALVEGGIVGETHQAMKNMQEILKQHDLGLSDIFKCLVMIDDMPLLSGDRGTVEWNMIPMENISQIEVIKGASSVLFVGSFSMVFNSNML